MYAQVTRSDTYFVHESARDRSLSLFIHLSFLKIKKSREFLGSDGFYRRTKFKVRCTIPYPTGESLLFPTEYTLSVTPI